MKKYTLSILLFVCFALPSWGKCAGLAYVGKIEWSNSDKTDVMLICDTTANDTVWSLSLEGWMSPSNVLLIKTGDGKVLELEPYDEKFNHVTDSIGYSQLTGEVMEFYHPDLVLYYHITTTALNYIAEHGIIKMRCGSDTYFRHRDYKHNEFGKKLTDAYRQILYEMSPEYVPPKKPSIRDGF